MAARKGKFAGGGERLAAFLAGGLFALLHGRDGVPQAAQRDLILAALLLAAYACAFQTVRRQSAWLSAVSAGLAVTAVTIKPTVLPAAFVLLALLLRRLSRKERSMAGYSLAIAGGCVAPLLAVAIFLVRERSVTAFISDLFGLFPYHASLARRSPGYLLVHSISPVEVIVAVWVVALLLRTILGSRPASRPGRPERRQRMGIGSAFFRRCTEPRLLPVAGQGISVSAVSIPRHFSYWWSCWNSTAVYRPLRLRGGGTRSLAWGWLLF